MNANAISTLARFQRFCLTAAIVPDMQAMTTRLAWPLFTLCSASGIVKSSSQARRFGVGLGCKTVRSSQASEPNKAPTLNSRQATPPSSSGNQAKGVTRMAKVGL